MKLSPEARKTLEDKYLHLTKAADVIRQPGTWCKFIRDDKCGAYCAMGALDKAMKHPKNYWWGPDDSVVADLAENIPGARRYSTDVCHQVVIFNNSGSQKEVVALFDKTAAGMKCILDKDSEGESDAV